MKTIARRSFLQALGAGTVLPVLGLSAAHGQELDVVKVVVGFAPGGTTDAIGRRVADKLRGTYGKNVVVDTRAGAGGQIAIQHMKQAPTDGSTLLVSPAGQLAVFPHIYSKLPYDAFADVVPVSIATVFDHALAVGPAVPAAVKTVPEFLAWCRANPQQANFGSPGAGTIAHFVGELMSREGKADLKHAAYRGSQPAIADMLGGQLSAVQSALGDFMPHLSGGRCRLLGTSGAQRSRFTPTVPTYAEQGLKDLVINEWFGFFVPARTSPEVIQRANRALRTALASPEVVEGMAQMGLEASSSTPAELAARLKRDYEYWGPVVKAIGFKAES
jgi:tripartite-type tricarboxylate transporter receptor subunit TctC